VVRDGCSTLVGPLVYYSHCPKELIPYNRFNYLAFDVIGDLAFGAPFGMLEKGQDFAEVTQLNGKTTRAPAIEVLNRRGEVSGTIGCFPYIKPYAKYFPDPFFSQGM
jgi:benzoate 4-monooxygenase